MGNLCCRYAQNDERTSTIDLKKIDTNTALQTNEDIFHDDLTDRYAKTGNFNIIDENENDDKNGGGQEVENGVTDPNAIKNKEKKEKKKNNEEQGESDDDSKEVGEEEEIEETEEEKKKREEEEEVRRKLVEEEKALREEEERKKFEEEQLRRQEIFKVTPRGQNLRMLEMEIAEKKKEILEKIQFDVSLINMDQSTHQEYEYMIEFLFTNTENLDDCFTIGNTSILKVENNKIKFPEKFDINFLFERTQYLRALIRSSDGRKSEININLAKVITSLLQDLKCPINLMKQETKYFNGSQTDKFNPHLVMSFTRVTEFLDKKIPTLYVDFNYLFAAQVASRLRYEVISVKDDGEMKVLNKSNELIGKSPLTFAGAIFQNTDDFTHPDLVKVVFEFYDNDYYFGQFVLNRKEINKLLTSDIPIPYTITEGKQLHITPTNKPKPPPKVNINQKTQASTAKSPRGTHEPSENKIAKGTIYFRENRRRKFYDLLAEGLNTGFDIAIDFTSSNGDPKKETSLHTLKLENNKYAKAIKSCGNILKEYDDDQLFPVFGFGGVPENGKQVSHCFNINNKKDPSIQGMDAVINSYLDSLTKIQFVGPTYFQQILRTVIDSVKKEFKSLKNNEVSTYTICLLLTDGKIDDMNETKELLIEASKLPISIIIVGIGTDDFGKMETLDGNEIPLTSPTTGEQILRDIVQFVNFSEYENDGTKLAAKVLEAIPIQIEEFFRIRPLAQ